MDARVWVIEKGEVFDKNAAQRDNELFDYVVHDCFSGGGVPGHMFTKSFWQELTKVVKPEGVIAVVRLHVARAILSRISS